MGRDELEKQRGLPEEKVYEKFRADRWNAMTSAERMQTLRELESISASRNHAQPVPVVSEPMEGPCYGYYDGQRIVLNSNIIERQEMIAYKRDEHHQIIRDQNGAPLMFRHPVKDSNLQMMDTLFHEDRHSFQDQAARGRISQETLDEMGISRETVDIWRANNSPCNYVDVDVDAALYRIQPIEKDAFWAGEHNTKMACSSMAVKYGPDLNYAEYLKACERNGYERSLYEAKIRYGDTNIRSTMENKMRDRYYGTQSTYHNAGSASRVEDVMDRSMNKAYSTRMDNEIQSGSKTREKEEMAANTRQAVSSSKEQSDSKHSLDSNQRDYMTAGRAPDEFSSHGSLSSGTGKSDISAGMGSNRSSSGMSTGNIGSTGVEHSGGMGGGR